MDFKTAAEIQHLHSSYYTVWLRSPEGNRTYLTFTQRKSGTGLLKAVRRESVIEKLRSFGLLEVMFTKKGRDLVFDNGYRIEFGGTIRQEATSSS